LKAFWKIALSLKMAHTRPSYDYISWAKGMGIQDFKSLNITKIKKQLSRTSQKELRDIKK
jgi:hypothetical protein